MQARAHCETDWKLHHPVRGRIMGVRVFETFDRTERMLGWVRSPGPGKGVSGATDRCAGNPKPCEGTRIERSKCHSRLHDRPLAALSAGVGLQTTTWVSYAKA
jgi:hypothetical protein